MASLTDHEIDYSHSLPDERLAALPDERLAALPLVSVHDEPQIDPQEYECGCVTVTRITDRDYRRGERPFEMRLARRCGTDACELAGRRPAMTDEEFMRWCESWKPCRYCGQKFVGPVCPCEREEACDDER